jgi:ABC-type uncharacterized transport system auxiliary subunit
MRVRKTTIGPVIAGVLWLASVLGCASQAPVSDDNFYRLQLDTAPAAASSMLPATVAVARLQSSGVNNARALVYHDVAQPLQLRQYHYHYWIDTPPRLLQEELVSYLRRAGFAERVLSAAPGVRADYLISGKIRQFEESRSPKGSAVTVALELELLRRRDRKILMVKDYTQREAVNGTSMHDVAHAYTNSVARIFRSFADDMSKNLQH